jgi:methanogenic corrinoid protein MtbC1
MMSNDLVEAILNMREAEALEMARKKLQAGEDPLKVLEHCREALELVGKRFEEGTYFLPELMMSGEMLKEISQIATPFIQKEAENEAEDRDRVVIGTVQGDIHNIGKDIVVFLLDINGFEVHDLGVDVPAENFVDAITDVRPAVVGLSALLTTALGPMKNTIDVIKNAGLRDQVKIMVGGGAVDERVRKYADADGYGPDAMAAVNLCKQWVAKRS